MKNQNTDFTQGGIARHLVRFSLPLFMANLLQSLYGVVDMLVVGRIVGDTGLTAISNASMISFIINSFSIGLTMGGTVLAAQYKGAGDDRSQQQAIGTLFSMSILLSIVITLVAALAYRPIFLALKVPAEAMRETCDYMRIIVLGTICTFGYNAVCSILKGMGDSRSPLLFVGIATGINIILDILLVGPVGLGTKGAAYATVLSQGVSCGIAVLHLRRQRSIFDFRWESFRIRMDMLKELLRIGLPSAIQMVVVNISYLLVTGMLNVYGTGIAAASGIGLKVNTFAAMPCWAIGQTVTAMVSQNMGAKDTDRIRRIVKTGLVVNLMATGVTVLLVQVFATQIISIFNPSSLEAIKTGVMYLRICCSVNSLVYAAMYTFDAFAIGIGTATLAMFDSLLDSVVVRLFLSWSLSICAGMGFLGIYVAQALSPILPALVGASYFLYGRWRRKSAP